MKKFLAIIISILQLSSASDNFYYQNNKKVYLTPYNSSLRSNPAINYYQNEKGLIVGITDKLIVKTKDNVSIDDLLCKFNLSIEKNLGKNLYVLKAADKNLTIERANQLHQNENIEYAQPDFIKKRFSR
mgnify:CR=1 FL=1